MVAWKTELIRVFNCLFANPGTQSELIGLAVITLLVGFISLSLVARVFGMEAPSGLSIVVAFSVTYALSIAAVIAVRLYGLSQTTPKDASTALQIGVAAFSVLVIGIPLHCLLLRGNYVVGLLTVGTAIALTSLITMAAKGSWEAVVSGRAEMKRIEGRNTMIESEFCGSASNRYAPHGTVRSPRRIPKLLAPKKLHP